MLPHLKENCKLGMECPSLFSLRSLLANKIKKFRFLLFGYIRPVLPMLINGTLCFRMHYLYVHFYRGRFIFFFKGWVVITRSDNFICFVVQVLAKQLSFVIKFFCRLRLLHRYRTTLWAWMFEVVASIDLFLVYGILAHKFVNIFLFNSSHFTDIRLCAV